MPAAHEAVAVEDDIAIFAPERCAGLGDAVNVLSDVPDADLNELEIAAAGRGPHIACAVHRARLVRDDLFKTLEADELTACEETIPWMQLHFAANAKERAVCPPPRDGNVLGTKTHRRGSESHPNAR